MLADILICLVLIAIVTSIVHSLIKNKKQGKSLCSGAEYLLFEPLYPWQIGEEERFLTEEKIAKLLRKYIQILSDSVLEIEYQSVENGG